MDRGGTGVHWGLLSGALIRPHLSPTAQQPGIQAPATHLRAATLTAVDLPPLRRLQISVEIQKRNTTPEPKRRLFWWLLLPLSMVVSR